MSEPVAPTPKKSSGRKAPLAPAKIPNTGPNYKKLAPYAVTAVIVAVLIGLVRSSRYGTHGMFATGCVLIGLFAYMGLSSREAIASDDGLRKLMIPSALAVVVATVIPLFYTVYPPSARAISQLSQAGDTQTLDLQSGIDCWAAISAQVRANTPGHADYSLEFTKQGVTERIAGRLHPAPGTRSAIERQELRAIQGPGVVTVQMRGISAAIEAPLQVALYVRPVPATWLAAAYALLFLLAVIIDVGLYKRGTEPSFASAMAIPLLGVGFLQFRVLGESLGPDLLAALAVGVIAGGLGGEGAARLGRLVGAR
jgi:hypothetical protein